MKANCVNASGCYFGARLCRSRALTNYANNLFSNNMMHSRSIKRMFDNFRGFLYKYGTERDIVRFDRVQDTTGGLRASGVINNEKFDFHVSCDSALKNVKKLFADKFAEMGIKQAPVQSLPPKSRRVAAFA